MPVTEGTPVTHPLDPLSAEEIRQAAAVVRRDRGVGDGWRFASIELKEPAKADLPALESGRPGRPGGRSSSAGTAPTARRTGPSCR